MTASPIPVETIISAVPTIPAININAPELLKGLINYVATPGILMYAVYKFSSLETKVKTFSGDMKVIKKDHSKILSHVDIIRTYLIDIQGMKADLFSANSPVVLSEKGRTLLGESKFINIYKKRKKVFVKDFEKANLSTLAEIDEYTTKYLEGMKDDKDFENFKDIAFENGTSIDILLRVCAIYMRDEIAKSILK